MISSNTEIEMGLRLDEEIYLKDENHKNLLSDI